MNGKQIEHVLDLIDNNINSNMESVRAEMLAYLRGHMDQLAREIAQRGYGEIPTHIGTVTISREDVEAAYA